MSGTDLGSVGFTDRHARFLATVMLQTGVFVGRQYAAFAGITHGQKVHDFVERLVARKFVAPIELGSTGRTRIFHVYHKPLYEDVSETLAAVIKGEPGWSVLPGRYPPPWRSDDCYADVCKRMRTSGYTASATRELS